ncbi:MAG TPA: hypothetical protein PLW37_02525, partial [bacterium]|nr:hypothetical protein [bacterium]
SCGGPESYKTPIVNLGDIIQGECNPVGEGDLLEENFSAEVVNGDVVVEHLNILVPESTMMGIIDTDSNSSLDGKFNYYYLEASEQFISVREIFRRSSSEKNCYYDLRIKITNVSGGIYDLMLFNETGKLKFSKEIRVR